MIASLGTKTKIFFNFSQNPIRNQEIFTVSLWLLQLIVSVLVFVTVFIYFFVEYALANLKITSAIGHFYHNAATMPEKKSSITT